MSGNVIVYESNEFGQIRTITIEDITWFAGKDVANILGYSNPQKAIRDHVDEEDRTVNDLFTINGTHGVLINESGLYSLILQSKLPKAKAFKRWVTSEVLPAIRKTGSYTQAQENVSYMIPKTFSQALMLASRLQEQIEQDAPLVAYASAVSKGDDCVTIGTLAKIIEQKYHVKIGQNRLYAKMREDGILMKAPSGHKDHNRPTQRYIEAGWFILQGYRGNRPDGTYFERFSPYVTPKGRIALVDKYGRQVAEKQMVLLEEVE